VRPVGHVGGALILIAIVSLTLDESQALWFTAISVPASLLPDVDLYLPYFPHQGVVHTYSVMFLVSIAGGFLAAGVVATLSDDRRAVSEHVVEDPKWAFTLTVGAMILGTFTHVTLDILAYRESFTGLPVEPLWPFTDWVPRIEIFPPRAPLWNYGFLIVGIVLWLSVVGMKRRRSA
jgi:hypothetical protein